ncbi:hypothetical protein FGO68_gene10025 [Halteria grandinella]|uniref:TRP C-terminal domain-containing protein n=1 Tax=Halteria grandinella TaxID=5974 RepID=A0A8J8P1Z5_HALGN|nr:hypothetical protein FGO68_gene10025 [Halteria grandinella]
MSSCWHICNMSSAQNFAIYNNQTRYLTITQSLIISPPDFYQIICSVYDTGVPAKMRTAIVQIQMLHKGQFQSQLFLEPYIFNFTKHGQFSVDMGYSFDSQLTNQSINSSLLNISVGIPTEENEIQRKQISWQCINISNQSFTIQLEFADVKKITRKDVVRVVFIRPELFYDSENHTFKVSLDKSYIQKHIPLQHQIQPLASVIADRLGFALQSLLFANFALNILMAASMELLWGLINSLQLLVRTPLINLDQFPPLTKKFFISFLTVTNMDLLPSSQLNEYLFGNYVNDEFEQRFTEMGYDSRNAVDNIGSFLYSFGFIGILVGLSKMMISIGRVFKKAMIIKIGERAGQGLVWNSVLRLLIETSLDTMIASLIRIELNGQSQNTIDLAVAISVLLMLWVALAVNFRFIISHKSSDSLLRIEHIFQRFGAFFEGLKTNQRRGPLLYNVILVLRRFAFAFSVIQMGNYTSIQILVFQIISLLILVYLIIQNPFESSRQNKLEIFNELILLLTSAHLIIFTDIHDPSISDDTLDDIYNATGFSLLAVCGLQVAVGGAYIVKDSIHMISLGLQRLRIAYLLSQKAKYCPSNASSELSTEQLFHVESSDNCEKQLFSEQQEAQIELKTKKDMSQFMRDQADLRRDLQILSQHLEKMEGIESKGVIGGKKGRKVIKLIRGEGLAWSKSIQ